MNRTFFRPALLACTAVLALCAAGAQAAATADANGPGARPNIHDPAKFEQFKQEELQRIGQHQQALTQLQSCVQAATAAPQLKACHDAARAARPAHGGPGGKRGGQQGQAPAN